MKLTKSKLRQIIQEVLENGTPTPEEKEIVKDWIQSGGTWKGNLQNQGVRRLQNIDPSALGKIVDELKAEGFVTQLRRDYWGAAPPGTEPPPPKKSAGLGIMKTPGIPWAENISPSHLSEVIKEVLSEALPLGLTYADQAAAAGLGKVGRPPPSRPEDPADELLAKWAADIRSRPPSPTLEAVVDFLMNYPAFEDAWAIAQEDERDIEDRS